MRLGEPRVVLGVGLARPPLAGRLVDLADRAAQGAALADRLAELLRELPGWFWLARSPRVAAIWCRRTSGSEKCWNSATMSANAS